MALGARRRPRQQGAPTQACSQARPAVRPRARGRPLHRRPQASRQPFSRVSRDQAREKYLPSQSHRWWQGQTLPLLLLSSHRARTACHGCGCQVIPKQVHGGIFVLQRATPQATKKPARMCPDRSVILAEERDLNPRSSRGAKRFSRPPHSAALPSLQLKNGRPWAPGEFTGGESGI